ncbi:MAG: hypothetical protein Fur0017_06400 [Anaerolineales bacterium]
MGIGQRGMLFARKVMGAAALEFMQKDKLHKQVVEEFKARRAAGRVKIFNP